MIEIWKNIVGYEGLYQVSNWGRVKSLDRVDRFGRVVFEKILTGGCKNGYFVVNLCKDGKQKCFYVHRLVAQAFMFNPDNLPQVNHKDENKENNFVFIKEDGSVDFNKSNLEWCPQEYNLEYGTARERQSKANRNGKLSKSVYQYTLDGTFVREWSSVREVQRQTGWSSGNISQCCRGEYKQTHGFLWSYNRLSIV